MSNHVSHFLFGPFPGKYSAKSGGGGVKYVFLGLRRQLRCLAEGKKTKAAKTVLAMYLLSETLEVLYTQLTT
jgi:hypothetical protein